MLPKIFLSSCSLLLGLPDLCCVFCNVEVLRRSRGINVNNVQELVIASQSRREITVILAKLMKRQEAQLID